MPTAFLADRAVMTVSGPDARGFLQNLVTCDVEALQPGAASFGALLTPQGKILFDFFVVCVEPELFLLDAAAHHMPALVKRLGMYKLRAHATIAATDKQVVAVWGRASAPQGIVFRDPRADAMGLRVILAGIDDLGDVAAYETQRIALGIPKGGADFVWGDTFPHEANMDWLGGVSFTKGCYVGQEVVSRTQHRGTARRRILPVTFDGMPPLRGAEIRAGDTLLGTVGSAVEGRDGEPGRALAGVRIDRLAEARDAGTPVIAEGHALAIALPG